MSPFLSQIASLFYKEYGPDISRLAFVFPNQRAGLFFKKYLSELTDTPVFSPTILTIKDLFLQLSGKQTADRIHMLFSLYTLYIEISGSTETFDEFLYWGEMLLNDFDDIDKYKVDAKMLFTNVTDLRQIETDFSFLNPKQIAAIRSFWSSFYPKGDATNQREFLAVWQILYTLYEALRNRLAAEGVGYEGMIFREVVEKGEVEKCKELGYEQVVFVGLNALSVVEESLLEQLKQLGIADFYWDYASEKVTDPENRASFFVDRNRMLFPSQRFLPVEEKKQAVIETIGIPSGIGQAKQVYSLLQEICQEGGMSETEALRTAIILPDEHLLIPTLNSIPEEIRYINVTMGYPLSATPVASLVDSLLCLQKNIRYVEGQAAFYFRDVLPVLNHRYISSTCPEVIPSLVKEIVQNNRIYIGYETLNRTPFLALLFTPVAGAEDLSDYLIRLLEEINKQMNRAEESTLIPPAAPVMQEAEEEIPLPEEKYLTAHTQLDSEFLFHYFTTVNRLKEVMKEAGVEMQTDTYARLLKRAVETINIPFQGEPLAGLQIMGVLETRALDFDRLIILSMNEGIFPKRAAANSFIPYNLRRGFGLPTYEHQDSVWAYHFYRLIHRATKVSLLYDTRTNGLQSGEVSRFVHQLHYHYEMPIRNKLVVYNVSSSQTPVLEVKKTEPVMKLLEEYRKGGPRAISASAINTYLDCPLKFYFSVVENVREEEEVTEAIESSMFGSILHATLETLYEPLCGRMISADILKRIRKDKKEITEVITKAFATEFFKTENVRPLTGQNYLIGEMIRKYVEKVLEWDGKLTPFQYIQSEKRMNDLFELTDGREIQLKGYIDRIDEVGDVIRIIDYKSGSGLSVFHSIESLFDKEEKDRPKAVMQVFMYAWMYNRLSGNTRKIYPGIYYMRTLFSAAFDAGVWQRVEKQKQLVEDFREYAESFEEGMRNCLDEIFDREKAFVQTPTGKACVYCQFKSICGK
ncbi:CRISPR/Cas system-associated exonuclease Cas4 (RecB family) [Parabacteroides sp. PM5-20]|uniref:PD-(D/E)XK nuclease family protein n=1 Tax=Parabacteroides sp. PM5-20 TaxID=2940527 RepID=UPI002473CDE8|nr:PD-(D/E)XK nuclease family protein [Parabacteroides sp. PM5-20]MDH6534216.1 CRISPR/Cas system-associated exonuclease Cas4 (RecB family) [Parabacteroides sp. PM5-20]